MLITTGRPRRTFPTRAVVVVLGAASLLLVGACTAPAASSAPASPAGPVPAPELATFYDQRIAFEPCAPFATTAADAARFADRRFDCARVEVPLDYADPAGPRAQVALLRAKARGDKIGSLLVNPGGPGVSGMSHVATTKAFWDTAAVGERFDVVGFDPRGVGATTPRADCFTDAEYAAGRVPFDGAVPGVADEPTVAEVARRCTEGSGGADVLTGVGTVDVVRDMDVLRAALGDEKLSYLGYSYGTELGGMYAEAFPGRVRALALDGAVDPSGSAADFSVAQFAGYQQAFTGMATACAAQPGCVLGPDPARAVEVFHAIVRPLLDRPVPTAGGRELTFDGAVNGVLGALKVQAYWPVIPRALAELTAGRGDLLLRVGDTILGRGPDGRYASDFDLNRAVRCMDDPRRTPAEQTRMVARITDLAPMVDDGRPTERFHECAGWPAPPSRPSPWLTGKVDVPPTLVVSVTGDPATPHQGGITFARTLGADLLTVDGNQHGIALTGQSPCVDDIVTGYLVDLRTPPADARCTA